ncbi:hypothetical protein chiPu_0009290 [Chiloscyllium punctatum]|uniref:Uncharacterized protein n=1 Tax=Chiloscyllium punctatum TaxID=137246 RepID=A0A401SKB9_CHIPU|nr:hypothetical protein [Chiloscyllium punctatum]
MSSVCLLMHWGSLCMRQEPESERERGTQAAPARDPVDLIDTPAVYPARSRHRSNPDVPSRGSRPAFPTPAPPLADITIAVPPPPANERDADVTAIRYPAHVPWEDWGSGGREEWCAGMWSIHTVLGSMRVVVPHPPPSCSSQVVVYWDTMFIISPACLPLKYNLHLFPGCRWCLLFFANEMAL